MKVNCRRNSIQVWVFLFTLFLVLSACATFEIRDFNIEAPPSTKIPLQIGLCIDSQFRDRANYVGTPNPQALGQGMSRAAERVFEQAFQRVVVIDSRNCIEVSNKGIEAIAIPEILHARQKGFSLYQITCKWTIINCPDGKVVYMNSFAGEGRDKSFGGKTRIEKAMTLAAKDSLEKFLAHASSTKWWEAIK